MSRIFNGMVHVEFQYMVKLLLVLEDQGKLDVTVRWYLNVGQSNIESSTWSLFHNVLPILRYNLSTVAIVTMIVSSITKFTVA